MIHVQHRRHLGLLLFQVPQSIVALHTALLLAHLRALVLQQMLVLALVKVEVSALVVVAAS